MKETTTLFRKMSQKNIFFWHSLFFLTVFNFFFNVNSINAQTVTVYALNANDGSGSVVTSSGAISYGNPISVSSTRRTWAVFDLSTLPSGATISGVTLQTTLNAIIATNQNAVYGVPGNQNTSTSLASFGTLAGSQSAGGDLFSATNITMTGNPNDNMTVSLNAASNAFIQSNLTGMVTFVISPGSVILSGSFRGGTEATRPRLIITYTLPPCQTPTSQPTGPVSFANITSGTIDGSFTADPNNPTGYLVVRYPSGATPTSPVDGTTYTIGSTIGTGGNQGTVVHKSNITTFSATGLSGGTNYDFYIYSYNGDGSCSEAYNTVMPLTGSQSTSSCLPINPISSITTVNSTINSIEALFSPANPIPSGGYLVVRYLAGATITNPIDGVNYLAGQPLGAGTIISTGTNTNFTASGLSPGNAYTFYVYSINNGNGCAYAYNTSNPLSGNISTLTCAGPGNLVKTIPGDYNSITDGLADLQTTGISGPVIFELQSTYTTVNETLPILISNNACFGPINNLTIRPASGASGLQISSNNNGPTIDFDGAKYITIDGTPGGSVPSSIINVTPAGAINPFNLNIINTSNSGMAVRLNNEASNNTIKFCDLQGQNNTNANVPTGNAGVVYIGNTGANGNDFITIDNCNIHSSSVSDLPTIGIYSQGPTNNGYNINFNEYGIISNCNIYDFFRANTNSAGIELNQGVSNWTIAGNSLFQTASRTFTSASYNRAIWVVPDRNTNSVGNGFVVTNNFIGGSEPFCGGTALTVSGNGNSFDCIRLEVKGGTTPSIINGNTITNISQTTTTTADAFRGIALSSPGSVNVEDNIIGGDGANSLITISAGSGSHSLAMLIATNGGNGTFNIKRNIIGGITLSSNGNNFSGIFINNSGIYSVDSNTIGSEFVANSIQATNTGTTNRFLRAINISSGSPTISFNGNIIANLSNLTTSTSSGAQVAGITIPASSAILSSINNNKIFNLNSSSRSTAGSTNAAVLGIGINVTTNNPITVSNNHIHSLISTAPTQGVFMEGIFFFGPTSGAIQSEISNNLIHSFDFTASGNSAGNIRGLEINQGRANVFNNMISLGVKSDGTSLVNSMKITGIMKGSTQNCNIWFNTVSIVGDNVGTATGNHSTAFRKETTNGTDNVRNNIFSNTRSNATTGSNHYSIWVNSTSNVNYDYNLYEYSGANGGNFSSTVANGNTVASAIYSAGWITGDDSSKVGAPMFVAPLGTSGTIDLHIAPFSNSLVESAGIDIPAITVDFDGETRSGLTPVDIGADAGDFSGAQVNISANNSPVCEGSNIELLATSSDTGSYAWTGPNNFIGSGPSVSIANATLANAGVYTVVFTSGILVSNPVSDTVVVFPIVTPSISISVNQGNSICSGDTAVFIATISNGGSSPAYQWFKNGNPVGGNSLSYTDFSLITGDFITCQLTSNAPCASSLSATSNGITVNINSIVIPSISITSNVGNTVCNGQPVTFSASTTNEGLNPVYQWKKDGLNVGANAATYIDSTLIDGTIITCELISNAPCVSPSTIVSSGITMNVNTTLVPTISIVANSGNLICSGQTVTFTATATNAGTNPSYQWYKNGNNVGTNSNTYIDNNLADNDTINCELTSNETCSNPINVFSSEIIMQVTTSVLPAISILASPGNSICAGTQVSFTASVTNEGSNPSYQWKINGTNVGNNSANYQSSTLQNGDIITCELTSDALCASNQNVTSLGILMNVSSPSVPTIVINTNTGDTICPGTPVTFTAIVTNEGNSPIYQWFKNATPVGTNSNVYIDNAIANNDIITCELTSNAACLSSNTALSQSITMIHSQAVTPTLNIVSNSGSNICAGAQVVFTANAVNGGANPTFQWFKNGNAVGSGLATYTDNTLASGDAISCTATSSASCATTPTANSNIITVTVNPSITPTISISANPGNTICTGQSVTFTATITNGGASPSYQWKKNGANVGTNSATYMDNALANNDAITCELTSNALCASPHMVLSSGITMTVNPILVPTISISANPGNTICSGTSVTFNATITNGGTNPSYQWKKNGANVGTNSATYTDNILSNNDVIICELTSSAVCAAPSSVSSLGITMIVNPILVPTISISANPGNTICSGTSVTFNATITNGGINPSYQWKKNGANVGTNLSTYIDNALANNDIITCELTSNALCASPLMVLSSGITMTVNPVLLPTITISANPGNTICSGQSVTFTAAITNGGANPSYQWKKNGANVGTNSAIYTDNALANGNVITCIITSNATCASPISATSNVISMIVTPSVTPTIVISANPGNTICSGTSVTFSAVITNGGTNPSYQWKKNGINVGTSSPTYIDNTLINNDVISCVLTGNAVCATSASQTSNGLTMIVTQTVTPTIIIVANPGNTICSGTSVTFTATITNGGASPSYQWKKNGANVGTNSATYIDNAIANGAIITCVLTSNAPCANPVSPTSNAITFTVTTTVNPTITISANPSNTICDGTPVTFTANITNGGTNPVYQWRKNGANVGINANTYIDNGLLNGDIITCSLASSLPCVTLANITSTAITMTVNPIVVPTVSISANPGDTACEGTNITFTATITNGGTNPLYQWKRNGANVGSNANTYTPNVLVNGDTITCTLTSNANCATPASATSNTIIMVINPILLPTISILSSAGNTICAGTDVTFTSTITNGGSSPDYLWTVNGNSNGTGVSFTTNTLNNGDIVSCQLTSNYACAVPPIVNANIVMTVNPVFVPSITITANPSTNITLGQTVTFNAVAVNGGSNPIYQWTKNSLPVGANSNTFISNTLNDNDTIVCTLTSSTTCAIPNPAKSNNLIIKVFTSVLEVDDIISEFKLYPNPNNGQFTIEGFLNSNSGLTIELINHMGQVIYSEKLNSNSGMFKHIMSNSLEIKSGIYWLNVFNENDRKIVPVSIIR